MGLVCSGCQTASKDLFSASGPGWHVQEGQALWKPGKGLPEIGGDLVLASDAEKRCLLQFTKTPLPLFSGQVTSNRWLFQVPARQLGFSGHGRPPVRLTWLYLPAALRGEPLPPAIRFERKADGGWRLENGRSGEVVEGFLSP